MQVAWGNAKCEDVPQCSSASLLGRGATELLKVGFECELATGTHPSTASLASAIAAVRAPSTDQSLRKLQTGRTQRRPAEFQIVLQPQPEE